MDNSDEDNLQAKKQKMDEAEHTEIEETCQEKQLLLNASPVKQKSESGFEIISKRSTDNVEKKSDSNLTECTKIKDIDLAVDNLKKSEQHSSAMTLPDNTNETIKEGKNWVDHINTNEKNTKTSKETQSTTHESSVSTCSSIFNLSEGYISKTENSADSESYEIDSSCKEETKIIEPLSEKEVTELSKVDEIESFSMRKQMSFDTPIISTVKRKSQQMLGDKIKRKRSTYNLEIEARNDEIVTDISNVQDILEKPEESLGSTAVSINTTGGGIEQNISINQTDQSAITYTEIKPAGETDLDDQTNSEVCNISKSSKHSPSEKVMQQQEEIARGIRHTNPQILELMSNQRTSLISMKSELPENQSDKTSKTDSATIREVKDTRFLKKMYKKKNPVMLPTMSAVDRPSTSKMEPNIDSEDQVQIGDDPQNVSRSNDEDMMHKEYEDSKSTDDVGEEYAEIILTDAMIIGYVLKFIEDEDLEIINISQAEFNARYLNLKLILEENLRLLIDYQKAMEQPAEVAYDESIQEMLENNERPPNPVALEVLPPDTLNFTQNPNKSADSERPENKPDKTSDNDSTMIRGVKDTRYLKKFYKRNNLVPLPTNSDINRPSTSKVEPNIDFEENEKQIIRNDLQIASRSSEGIAHEEFEDGKSSEHAPSEEVPTHQEVTAGAFQYPGFMPLEDLENNAEFVQSRQHILELKSHQRQSLIRMKPESDHDKGKLPESLKNKDQKVKIDSSDKDSLPEEKLERDQMENTKIKGICSEEKEMVDTPVRSPVKRKSQCYFEIKSKRSMNDAEEYEENFTEKGFEESTEDKRKVLSTDSQLIGIVLNYMNDLGREIINVTREEFKYLIDQLRSIIKSNPDLLRDYQENMQQEISENNERPLNLTVSRSRGSIVHEKSNDPKISLKDENILKEKRKPPETSASASGNASFMQAKNPIEVKKHEKYEKGLAKQKPESADRSHKEIQKIDTESTKRSNSSKNDNEGTSAFKNNGYEGLAERIFLAFSPSRPPPPAHSPSRPPPPAHSPSRPPPPAHSPSRPPLPAAGPSRPPPPAAGSSRPPPPAADPSLTK